MSDANLHADAAIRRDNAAIQRARRPVAIRLPGVPLLLTALVLAGAGALSWAAWQAYMAAPWTRDGTVRAYVVTVAPEVAGRVVQLPVIDNQFVHKGDLLMIVDPTNYEIAVAQARAALLQAQTNAENAERESERRARLSTLETSEEEKQTYASTARAAEATYQQAQANLALAQVNFARTRVVSPVNGYITNLQVQSGDYVTEGESTISVVDSDSFWVDGYFEETSLDQIKPGDPATIKLMGYRQTLRGHVSGIARGIVVANAEPGGRGLANVNPIFTWVRLAQRVPVRIHIDHVPEDIRLVVGETATIQIERTRN
ncbi:MAG TPA: HlyD family secretion protein [Acetobacteraceae bacterium]|nr:HlyD family secretion protein [Acetobacteraceae bacterium]